MAEVFNAKLRRVGNSLGVIIPNKIISEMGYMKGDVLQMAIPQSDINKRNKNLQALAGIDKKADRFKRDKRDRF
jgi:antitoxin component of MazEF toxin-antitoxin module